MTRFIESFSSGGGSVEALDEFLSNEYKSALIPLPIEPLLLLIKLLYFRLNELGGLVVVGVVVVELAADVVAGEAVDVAAVVFDVVVALDVVMFNKSFDTLESFEFKLALFKFRSSEC